MSAILEHVLILGVTNGPGMMGCVRRPWLTRNVRVLSAVSFLQDAASELLYPLLPIYLTVGARRAAGGRRRHRRRGRGCGVADQARGGAAR